MRYSQLKAFDAVALEGSFSEAARQLGITQPAVTYQVRTLEKEYDCLLFRRETHRSVLTSEGDTLFAITRKMFEAETEAHEYLDSTQKVATGFLRLASDAPQFVLDLLEPFLKSYPDIRLSISFGNSREVWQQIMDKKIDAAVMSNPPDDDRVINVPFHQHELCVILPKGHPLTKARSIDIKDLKNERLLMREQASSTRQAVEEIFSNENEKLSAAMELRSHEAVKEATAKGFGVGFVFQGEAEGDARIVTRPLTNQTAQSINALVCLKGQRNRRIINALIEIAEKMKD